MQFDTASQSSVTISCVKMNKFYPYFLILLGLLILFIIGQPIAAGVCLLIGIVMVIESIWPERWEHDTIS